MFSLHHYWNYINYLCRSDLMVRKKWLAEIMVVQGGLNKSTQPFHWLQPRPYQLTKDQINLTPKDKLIRAKRRMSQWTWEVHVKHCQQSPADYYDGSWALHNHTTNLYWNSFYLTHISLTLLFWWYLACIATFVICNQFVLAGVEVKTSGLIWFWIDLFCTAN